MNKRFLPVGIQVFERMITGNFVYVDKTRYIHEMAMPPQGFYFLARPRRFGKSLLVSTMESLFKGEKELFRDFYIAKTPWDWKTYPVIKIDFSTISFETPEQLEENLIIYINRLCGEYGIKNPYSSLKESFATLIIGIYKKRETPVVLLVDEYDKPIIDHLGRGEEHLKTAGGNRDKLKQLFGVIKGGDVSAALRFVFITGISKFARVSIFSDLNNLNDISMQEKYAAILGYTREELQTVFKAQIERLAKLKNTETSRVLEEIHMWYNGYRFTEREKKVYNPFSVVKLFDSGQFQNYWFETATPSFLMNLIREQDYPIPEIETLVLEKEAFTVYEPETLELEPILFQTGYITIRHFDGILFQMGYPNQEVKISFLSYLYRRLVHIESKTLKSAHKKLHMYLNEKRMEKFINAVKSIMANIPYTQIAGRDEGYYHSVFYLMLASSGVSVSTEVLSSSGRLDITAEFSDKIYIIELKCDQSSQKAVNQIIDKRYYEKYQSAGKAIYLMGINFNSSKRTVDDFRWGKLDDFLKKISQ